MENTKVVFGKDMLIVSLRQHALYLPDEYTKTDGLTASTMHCLKQLRRCGLSLDEDALWALNSLDPEKQGIVLEAINEVLGVNLNWNPLTNNWLEPTGEGLIDHLVTVYANFLKSIGIKVKGTTLQCGHLIPDGTFDLSRYNGCPFCGKPFRINDPIYFGQGSRLKILKRWTQADAEKYLEQMLKSSTPLDGNMTDSLKRMLNSGMPIPKISDIPVRETCIIVISHLCHTGRGMEATPLFKSPNDVLRYLWYEHTGNFLIIKPKTLIHRELVDNSNRLRNAPLAQGMLKELNKSKLKLHYCRAECKLAAHWLNCIDMDPAVACVNMHPRRGMWTRMIRALRLAEYSKNPGNEHLRDLLEKWFAEDYIVPQGLINTANSHGDYDKAVALLKKQPGAFARQLFATIVQYYPEHDVIADFATIADKLPIRLVYTLGMYAESYFESRQPRIVRTITGITKDIEYNHKINRFTDAQAAEIVKCLKDMVLICLAGKYAKAKEPGVKVYIAPQLFDIPLPIGDRSGNAQAMSSALPGTRFDLEGDKLRIFLNWGEGMPAQHLDLDISAKILYANGTTEDCFYGHLVAPGAKHSGDIREIPDMVGTAEYIELDLNELKKANAKFVAFTASNYSGGHLDTHARAGWMNSAFPMTVSNETGVAYDPSCVQHMVSISQRSLTRTLIFGVLDVDARQVIWLEMGSDDQAVFTIDTKGIVAYLKHLHDKTTVGQALETMAKAREMTITDDPVEADRVYDTGWVQNVPEVLATLEL